MVNAAPDFVEHSRVINGCSDLFVEIFGERHARSAIGVGSLPFGITVEIEAIFEADQSQLTDPDRVGHNEGGLDAWVPGPAAR